MVRQTLERLPEFAYQLFQPPVIFPFKCVKPNARSLLSNQLLQVFSNVLDGTIVVGFQFNMSGPLQVLPVDGQISTRADRTSTCLLISLTGWRFNREMEPLI